MASIVAIGRRFGQLEILERAGQTIDGNPTWLCRCACGKELIVASYLLVRPHTPQRSCGCSRKCRARIKVRGKTVNLGYFASRAEAQEAERQARAMFRPKRTVSARQRLRFIDGGVAPDDVLLNKCITCGQPSVQGLCATCLAGPRKLNYAERRHLNRKTQDDDLTGEEVVRLSRRIVNYCTCAECMAGRTREPSRPRYGWVG